MGAQAVRLSNVDIDNALKNKDFEVLFQPIFDLGNGALARMESFVRWRHASLGLLPPGAFISFFESQGRMSELSRYVLNQSLSEYREWRGSSAPGFSINLALSDLADDAFAAHFEVMLRDCGFPPELITLECPMPPVDQPIEAAARQFERLADTGARLAIEVRGRANDFLRAVDPFPFDEIKTGGAAILRFARTVRGPGLSAISELIDIAAKANAAITAVGVEDQASLSALRGLGFAAAQGNHLARVGDLNSFAPSRVNEVRVLLGLEPLSTPDLHGLFRTSAPALQAGPEPAHTVSKVTAAPVVAQGDALVERLAARIARQSETPEATGARPPAPVRSTPIGVQVGVPASGLDPARAAARAATAAAIARAKKRAQDAASGEVPVEPAARQLQERLTREFGGDNEVAAVATPEPEKARDQFDLDDAPATAEAAVEKASEAAVQPAVSATRDIDAAPLRAAADGSSMISMAVGAARAYFRPGMRIGVTGSIPPAPRLRDTAAARPRAPEPQPSAAPAPAPESPPPDAKSTVSAEKGQARSALDDAEMTPAPSIAMAVPEAVHEAVPAAPADTPAPTETQATPEARAVRRGFLQRTVVPYPTHFWPRSWTRAWRRRQNAIETRGSDASAAQ
ncbi:MAG: EAL domain-containing protein [Parvularculaceae bacterium]